MWIFNGEQSTESEIQTIMGFKNRFFIVEDFLSTTKNVAKMDGWSRSPHRESVLEWLKKVKASHWLSCK